MKYELVDADYVKTHLSNMPIVDVRPEHMYAESRIPGALSVPYMAWRNSGKNSGMKLAELFKAKGIYENTHVIVYCHDGGLAQEACDQLHDEGYYNLHCYQGSWVDWVSDSARPVDTRALEAASV